jgi:hypothetical protein
MYVAGIVYSYSAAPQFHVYCTTDNNVDGFVIQRVGTSGSFDGYWQFNMPMNSKNLVLNFSGTTLATFNAAANSVSFVGSVSMGALTATTAITSAYAVASLPAGSIGMRAFANNALAPVWGSAVVGGGAVVVPVFHDGVSWKVG